MESPATSYSVYPPGNLNPSRPPMRRSAPEEAKSGFPFLVAMAGLVLAVAIGAVARFCPQDLRIDHGGSHAAKPATMTTTTAATIDPPAAAPSAPIIAPTTFTTIGDVSPAPAATVASAKKKVVRRSGLPATRGSTASAPATSASAAAASGSPDIPENPYSAPSNPDTYGF